MTEYALSVFSILVVVGIGSLVCYGSAGAEKQALWIIAAFVILSPIISALGNIEISDIIYDLPSDDPQLGDGYSAVVEEAFSDGVARAVADKFLLKEENIRVKLSGFDAKEMRAEKIKITLTGTAVMADRRGIENYVNSLNLGECKVEIEIGKQLP